MNGRLFTWLFWRDTVERSVSTAAQAALLAIGSDLVNVNSVDLGEVLGFAVGGAVLSVLKALAARSVGDSESASLDPAVGVDPPPH